MNETSLNIANKIGIDTRSYKNCVNKLLQNFATTPYIPQKKSPIKNATSPVFIVGFPRSGTTLLDTVLRSHPKIEVVEEKPLIDKIISRLNKTINSTTLSNLSESNIIDLRAIYRQELLQVQESVKPGKIIIDKFPLNIIHIPLINILFPDSKYIFALRHPYDCVLSCFMQNFELNEAMVNFLSMRGTVNLYSNVMKLWSIYSKTLLLDVEFVKYEHLTSNFEETSTKILSFLGLEWHNNLLKFYETGKARNKIMTPSYHQVTEQIYHHATDRWKNYIKNLKGDIDPLKPWLSYFSYND